MEIDWLGDPAVRAWAAATLLVCLKTMAAGTYTSVLRIRKRIYISPEDFESQGHPVVEGSDPEIERARRIHQNDLENGLPFIAIGFIYALTGPASAALWICFAGFPVARILHSFFYAGALMPHRTIAFTLGFGITLWMAGASLFELIFD